MQPGTWTDDRTQKLVKLWSEGYSASQVAEKIGVTRNSVISKVNRMGLPERPTRVRKPSTGYRKPRRKTTSAKRELVPPQLAEIRRTQAKLRSAAVIAEMNKGGPEPLMIPLVDLERHHCRWGIGDALDPDFGFCGHTKKDGSSYCSFHASRAYKPLPIREEPKPWRTAA